jgi:hypothetical protein
MLRRVVLERVVFCSVLRLLVTANIVPSSQILVAMTIEAIRSSETSGLIRTTRRNIQKMAFLNLPSVHYPQCIFACRVVLGLSAASVSVVETSCFLLGTNGIFYIPVIYKTSLSMIIGVRLLPIKTKGLAIIISRSILLVLCQ